MTEGARPPRSGLPTLRAIGTLRTPFRSASGTPIQGLLTPETEGTVELDPAYAEGLADLAGFSHLILLYAFDRTTGFRLTVTPYLDTTPRGLFATRAPRRPNPIGLTVVRLLAVDGPRLRVAGVDMLDGTPLLDIKPFVARFDAPPDSRSGWLERGLTEADGRSASAPRADDRFHEPSPPKERTGEPER
ncbi:MAG: tRNA (N6-threonylcarbamoyladenosine(37)-N6)-methyltransferase TrmO [Deltaproteobacteria bacterium]|nr:tRNA (N6-threonylcarbamoyladenosine(37)-N6)-methyltransferase TrmO [Deltaproteobacteria bacterium]